MTYKQLSDISGLTVTQLHQESLDYLQCEGYDDDGREYATLADWVMRRRLPRWVADENEMAILACERGEMGGAM